MTLTPFLKQVSKIPVAELEDKILDRVNSSGATFLGSGDQGSAFDVGGGRVLKLTKDKSEAAAMGVVMAHPSTYVVPVYDVFKLGSNLVKGKLYGILQDKLSKPDKSWSDFIECIVDYVITDLNKGLTPTDVESFANDDNVRSPRSPCTATKVQIAWLRGLADYFSKAHIRFSDFHAGNLMKDSSGRHRLIDLGMSKAPRVNIPTYESSSCTLATSLLEDFYSMPDRISLQDIVSRMRSGDLPVLKWDVMLPPKEVWPYREFSRTRDDNRHSSDVWDSMKKQMATSGWEVRHPLTLLVANDGNCLVVDGNHRLALAIECGISLIPVRLEFVKSLSVARREGVTSMTLAKQLIEQRVALFEDDHTNTTYYKK